MKITALYVGVLVHVMCTGIFIGSGSNSKAVFCLIPAIIYSYLLGREIE